MAGPLRGAPEDGESVFTNRERAVTTTMALGLGGI